jgi:hypothetical protein
MTSWHFFVSICQHSYNGTISDSLLFVNNQTIIILNIQQNEQS